MADLKEEEILRKSMKLYERWTKIFTGVSIIGWLVFMILRACSPLMTPSLYDMSWQAQVALAVLVLSSITCIFFLVCLGKRQEQLRRIAEQEFADRAKWRQIEHDGLIREVSQGDDNSRTTVVRYADGHETNLGRYPLFVGRGTPVGVKVTRDGNDAIVEVQVHTERFSVTQDGKGSIVAVQARDGRGSVSEVLVHQDNDGILMEVWIDSEK